MGGRFHSSRISIEFNFLDPHKKLMNKFDFVYVAVHSTFHEADLSVL